MLGLAYWDAATRHIRAQRRISGCRFGAAPIGRRSRHPCGEKNISTWTLSIWNINNTANAYSNVVQMFNIIVEKIHLFHALAARVVVIDINDT